MTWAIQFHFHFVLVLKFGCQNVSQNSNYEHPATVYGTTHLFFAVCYNFVFGRQIAIFHPPRSYEGLQFQSSSTLHGSVFETLPRL